MKCFECGTEMKQVDSDFPTKKKYKCPNTECHIASIVINKAY